MPGSVARGRCTLHLVDLISTVGVILHYIPLVESVIPVQSGGEIIPTSNACLSDCAMCEVLGQQDSNLFSKPIWKLVKVLERRTAFYRRELVS